MERSRTEIFEKAKDAALTYLSYGMRPEAQMRTKLKEKGFGDLSEAGIIDDVILFLNEYKLIDDEKYAVSYIEYALAKGHGTLKIKNALKERGVEKNTIDDAFEEYRRMNEENGEHVLSESERAVNEALKAACGMEIDDKLIAKIGRRLKSRGFESRAIYEAVGYLLRMKKSGEDECE